MDSHEEKYLDRIEAVKEHVDCFSSQLQESGEPGAEVTIGGEIVRILDMTMLSDDDFLVYVTVDDGLDEILTLVPYPVFGKEKLVVGDIVVISGITDRLIKETVFVTKAGTTKTIAGKLEKLRVLVRSIQKISA